MRADDFDCVVIFKLFLNLLYRTLAYRGSSITGDGLAVRVLILSLNIRKDVIVLISVSSKFHSRVVLGMKEFKKVTLLVRGKESNILMRRP